MTVRTGIDPKYPELSEQVIHPYTDLLLHDLGRFMPDSTTLGIGYRGISVLGIHRLISDAMANPVD